MSGSARVDRREPPTVGLIAVSHRDFRRTTRKPEGQSPSFPRNDHWRSLRSTLRLLAQNAMRPLACANLPDIAKRVPSNTECSAQCVVPARSVGHVRGFAASDDPTINVTCPGNLGPSISGDRPTHGVIRFSVPPITRVRDRLQSVDWASRPNRWAFSAGVAPARAM